MPPKPSTTSDAPLGTFEEQVLLAVVRTGRAPDGDGAYGMAVRNAESKARCTHLREKILSVS